LAPRGIKVIQTVELTRDWYHLGIIVNPRTGDLTWSWLVSTQGIHLAPAVAEWHAHGFDVLVWDGLKGHGTAVVRATGMRLVEQPAASPELNPVERIGEALEDKIEGFVYGTIWHKMAAVERFLGELAADRPRVKHLVGWSWIIRSCRDLPRKGSH
jgi:hypothetical protein